MGRKKLDTMDYIQNANSRNIAYNKRKKGLVKKAMELSKLCGINVNLVVFDEQKKRLMHYNSTDEFSINNIENLLEQYKNNDSKNKYEKLTNLDYESLNLYGKQDSS